MLNRLLLCVAVSCFGLSGASAEPDSRTTPPGKMGELRRLTSVRPLRTQLIKEMRERRLDRCQHLCRRIVAGPNSDGRDVATVLLVAAICDFPQATTWCRCYLSDRRVVGRQRYGRKSILTAQVRDVALAALAIHSKQSLSEFNYLAPVAHPTVKYEINSLGFHNDAERKKAFALAIDHQLLNKRSL